MERLIECAKGFIDSEGIPVASRNLSPIRHPKLATLDEEGFPNILPGTEQGARALGQEVGAEFYSMGTSGLLYFRWAPSTN